MKAIIQGVARTREEPLPTWKAVFCSSTWNAQQSVLDPVNLPVIQSALVRESGTSIGGNCTVSVHR